MGRISEILPMVYVHSHAIGLCTHVKCHHPVMIMVIMLVTKHRAANGQKPRGPHPSSSYLCQVKSISKLFSSTALFHLQQHRMNKMKTVPEYCLTYLNENNEKNHLQY